MCTLTIPSTAGLATAGAVTKSGAVTIQGQLRCADVIDVVRPAGLAGYAKVLGRVFLPTRKVLPAVRLRGRTSAPIRWWAKQGLVIKSGRNFTLSVPRSWRGRFAFGWGSPARPTEELIVSGCGTTTGEWLAYAGGFWVDKRACVPMIVQSGKQRERINIGVGVACGRQDATSTAAR